MPAMGAVDFLMGPDFSKPIVETVAKRAAYRCSNPDCDKPTSGPSADEGRSVLIGEAAHIFGAKPGSSRYRESMTDSERGEVSNAVWLCRDCHALIDKDGGRYAPDLLFQWKQAHEGKILEQLGKPGELIRLRMLTRDLRDFPDIPGYVQELLLERPEKWEFRVTVELLDHYLAPVMRRSNQLRKGLYTLPARRVSAEDLLPWVVVKTGELSAITASLAGIIDPEMNAAWGPPGVPGDPKDIAHVCRLFGMAAGRLVDVAEELTFTSPPDGCRDLLGLLAEVANHPIAKLPKLASFIRENVLVPGAKGMLKYTVEFDLPPGWERRCMAEMKKVERMLSNRGGWWA